MSRTYKSAQLLGLNTDKEIIDFLNTYFSRLVKSSDFKNREFRSKIRHMLENNLFGPIGESFLTHKGIEVKHIETCGVWALYPGRPFIEYVSLNLGWTIPDEMIDNIVGWKEYRLTERV